MNKVPIFKSKFNMYKKAIILSFMTILSFQIYAQSASKKNRYQINVPVYAKASQNAKNEVERRSQCSQAASLNATSFISKVFPTYLNVNRMNGQESIESSFTGQVKGLKVMSCESEDQFKNCKCIVNYTLETEQKLPPQIHDPIQGNQTFTDGWLSPDLYAVTIKNIERNQLEFNLTRCQHTALDRARASLFSSVFDSIQTNQKNYQVKKFLAPFSNIGCDFDTVEKSCNCKIYLYKPKLKEQVIRVLNKKR